MAPTACAPEGSSTALLTAGELIHILNIRVAYFSLTRTSRRAKLGTVVAGVRVNGVAHPMHRVDVAYCLLKGRLVS